MLYTIIGWIIGTLCGMAVSVAITIGFSLEPFMALLVGLGCGFSFATLGISIGLNLDDKLS